MARVGIFFAVAFLLGLFVYIEINSIQLGFGPPAHKTQQVLPSYRASCKRLLAGNVQQSHMLPSESQFAHILPGQFGQSSDSDRNSHIQSYLAAPAPVAAPVPVPVTAPQPEQAYPEADLPVLFQPATEGSNSLPVSPDSAGINPNSYVNPAGQWQSDFGTPIQSPQADNQGIPEFVSPMH